MDCNIIYLTTSLCWSILCLFFCNLVSVCAIILNYNKIFCVINIISTILLLISTTFSIVLIRLI